MRGAPNQGFLRQQGTLRSVSTGATGRELAQDVLNLNAIKFEGSASNDLGTAYPFIYPFFKSPSLIGGSISDGSPLQLADTVYDGIAPDGLLFTNGQTKDIHIRMDRDMHFDLLEVKFVVRVKSLSAVAVPGNDYQGRNHFLATPRGFDHYQAYSANTPVPAYRNWKASMFIRSGQERNIFGGMSRLGRKGAGLFQEEPVEISNMQGAFDGKGSLRHPYLIAKEAVVTLRISAPTIITPQGDNDGPIDSQAWVDGMLFGYKVAV